MLAHILVHGIINQFQCSVCK